MWTRCQLVISWELIAWVIGYCTIRCFYIATNWETTQERMLVYVQSTLGMTWRDYIVTIGVVGANCRGPKPQFLTRRAVSITCMFQTVSWMSFHLDSPTITMSPSPRPFTSLMLRTGRSCVGHTPRPDRRRCFASIASTKGDGPLAGIRVLDMTRVLAGVRGVVLDMIPSRGVLTK
jgi:hypothetical protein